MATKNIKGYTQSLSNLYFYKRLRRIHRNAYMIENLIS